jgi:hypothetical protein
MVAVFGVAAFAQPAIGKSFLAGHQDVIGLSSSVYGTPLNVTVAVGLLLFFAGAVVFAIAISRSGSLPRSAGILFAAAVPVFAIGSITGTVLASAAALVEIGSAIWIARSASRTGSDPRSTTVTSDQDTPVLAAIVAGQPRRDPKLQAVKARVALQHAAAVSSGPASRLCRHGDLFRSCLHGSSDNPSATHGTGSRENGPLPGTHRVKAARSDHRAAPSREGEVG